MASRFIPNRSLPQNLDRLPGLRQRFDGEANSIAAEAQRLARSEAYDTGDYHDGIEGISGVDDQGHFIGRVNARNWKSGFVEFGTSRFHPKAILRRASESRGTFRRGEQR